MRRSVVVAVVGLLASAVCLAVFGARAAPAQEPSPPKTHGHEPGEHQHAQIPAAYAKAHLPGGAWLWRVSEGGLVEPFRSKGSVMPAWKGELSPRPRSWWRWGRRAPSSSSPTRPGTGHFTAT